jgi:hypothetical protein
MSLSASASSEGPLAAVGYLDVIVVALATPIMLLIGVPAAGYLVAAGSWIALRAVGAGVDRVAAATTEQGRELTLRMAYLLGRLFLPALVVIVVAFTMQLILSFATRGRAR